MMADDCYLPVKETCIAKSYMHLFKKVEVRDHTNN